MTTPTVHRLQIWQVRDLGILIGTALQGLGVSVVQHLHGLDDLLAEERVGAEEEGQLVLVQLQQHAGDLARE
eukprot:7539866-Alexandrium_andersonii.AAC.1